MRTNGSSRHWRVNDQGFLFAVEPYLFDITCPWHQVLKQLLDEERAEVVDGQVLIRHAIVADIPRGELTLLGLPPDLPCGLEIRASGNMSSPDVRYVYTFVDKTYRPVEGMRRMGTYVEVRGAECAGPYLVTGDLYRLLEAMDSFNNRYLGGRTGGTGGSTGRQEVIRENLLTFARIKGLAKKVGANLDLYLNSEQVAVPTKLKVRVLRAADGESLEVEPVLCGDQATGVSASVEAFDQAIHEKWVSVFDRFPRVHDMYSVPNGPRIVLEPRVAKALEPFKQYRRVNGEVKDAILYSPQLVFDPEVVDLDDFSDRVIEIGEHVPRHFGFLQPQGVDWLSTQDEKTGWKRPGLLARADQDMVKASRSEPRADQVGEVLPEDVNASTKSAEEELVARIGESGESTGKSGGQVPGKESSRSPVLVIIDDFEENRYVASEESRGALFQIPPVLRVKLLPHQQQGVRWLQEQWSSGARGALLADDMGLGKTLQALVFMAWVQHLYEMEQKTCPPMLIVAPLTLLENWKREYERFLEPVFGPPVELHGPGLRDFLTDKAPEILPGRAASLIKPDKWLSREKIMRCGLVLTTYETLREYQVPLGLVDWAIMVLDEAQKIKNPTAIVTRAAKAMKYEFGLCMTGTPVENSLVDLWSILDFARPGKLMPLREFVRQYQDPMRKVDTDREELGKKLGTQVRGFILRRLKDDHLKGLPEKKVYYHEREMPSEQLQAYRQVIAEAAAILGGNGGEKGPGEHVLGFIQRLRKVSLHPYLDLGEAELEQMEIERIIYSSARLVATMDVLDEVSRRGDKAVVFVLERSMQRVLQRILKERYGLEVDIVNGEVLGGRRQEYIDSFQAEPGFNVIIISPEAAGVGINVTGANHAIHLTRLWNPAKEDQATDRIYRIGQTRTVHVHIPMAVHPSIPGGTFDVKLNRLLEAKRKLSRSVLMPAVVEEWEWQKLAEEVVQGAGNAAG
ncbi:MAG TPA: DEAD/DEAH box helicase [Firmicutes bacterium]|nr:DEAD/DEAH box helicase [Candidatus Fermentithermobacillaceae bacterium]